MEKKYVYLAMPVEYSVKREWNKKGFKVLDAALMPESFDNPVSTEDKPKPAKGKSNA